MKNLVKQCDKSVTKTTFVTLSFDKKYIKCNTYVITVNGDCRDMKISVINT